MVKNFQEVVLSLRGRLQDYLESRGIATNRKFSCLHPKHADEHPSCVLLPDRTRFYCHSEGHQGDIFDAANYLENRPMEGPGFIIETLEPLAERFGILIERGQASEEELYQHRVYRAYQAVASWVASCGVTDTKTKTWVKDKGWDLERLANLFIGQPLGLDALKLHMEGLGYNEDFLREIDLLRADIFGSNKLVFTTCDEHGRPVGFCGRNMEWAKDCGFPKYVNQQTTGLKFDLFRKGKRLYNAHSAKRYQDQGLYLFEGQGDVITALHYGIENCVAIGGTALTKDQVLLIKELGFTEVFLCLDGDEAGQKNSERLLDDRFADHRDIRVRVVSLPDCLDPDDFLKQYGLEAFRALKRPTAFEWRLQRYLDEPNVDRESAAKAVIPLIVSEPSHITREDMCNVLAKNTGYSLGSIRSEVDRLSNVGEAKYQQERHLVLERAFRAIEREPASAESILLEAQSQLGQLSGSRGSGTVLSEKEFISFIEAQRELEETRGLDNTGFTLGPDLLPLQRALTGEWTKDVLMLVGGRGNAGKSSFLCKLAYEIARHSEENNACVIYHTIDDTLEQLLPKFVCIADGTKTGLLINEVRYPQYWGSQGIRGIMPKRHSSYESLKALASDGRLIVKDSNHGNGLPFIEALVTHYRRKYPERKIVFILDNFHKLPDFRQVAKENERVRFKALSEHVKAIATRHHVAFIATVEYTKLPPGQKPTNRDMAETVALDYDANIIAHLHNDLHDLGQYSQMFHMCEIHGEPQRLPIIECRIGKNKVTNFKDSMFFRFYPASSDFTPATAEDLRLAAQSSEEAKMEEGIREGRTRYRPSRMTD